MTVHPDSIEGWAALGAFALSVAGAVHTLSAAGTLQAAWLLALFSVALGDRCPGLPRGIAGCLVVGATPSSGRSVGTVATIRFEGLPSLGWRGSGHRRLDCTRNQRSANAS